jgi:hypothetical protein
MRLISFLKINLGLLITILFGPNLNTGRLPPKARET